MKESLPSLDARIRQFDDRSGKPTRLLALVDLVIGGAFVIKGIRILIVESASPAEPFNPFVVFPAEKGKGVSRDRWYDIAHPITPEAREAAVKHILARYTELVGLKPARPLP